MAIEVQTTQNVTLNFREAGLGARIIARIIDGIFIFIWVFGILMIFGGFSSFYYNSASDGFLIFLICIIIIPYIFYDLLFEYFNHGKSPGKALMKIQVVNLDGTTPSFGSYMLRWLFRSIDFTLSGGGVALLMVILTQKSQRLGDYLAGTTVINIKPEMGSNQLEIPDIKIDEDYVVTYSDILDKLNDNDIRTVRSLLTDYRYKNDTYTITVLSDKIKEVTGYVSTESPQDFLKRIIDDYDYLSML